MALRMILFNTTLRLNRSYNFLTHMRPLCGIAKLNISHFINASSLPVQKNVLHEKNISFIKMNYCSSAPPKTSKTMQTIHWVAERVNAISMLLTLPLAYVFPSKALDVLVVLSIVTHFYWGLGGVLTEYVRVILFGPLIPKIVLITFKILTMVSLGGFFYMIFDDIGFMNAVHKFWSIKPKN